MTYGKPNMNYSETEVGQRQENALIALIITIVKVMDFIIGREKRKMSWFVIMKS